MLNIVLFGPPGSGKGTQATNIITKYNLVHLSTGDMLRAEIAAQTKLGLEAKALMDKGDLVPDEVVIGMIGNKLANTKDVKGFIFDGFPRTVAQAIALDDLLDKYNAPIKTVLSLKVSEEELTRRILERGKTSGRNDDQNGEIVRNRVIEYKNKTAPLATYYSRQAKLSEVPGELTVEEVFETLEANIEAVRVTLRSDIDLLRTYITPISELEELLIFAFNQHLQFNIKKNENPFGSKVKLLVDKLRKDIWVFAETPYVDKTYRDTYYNFFSTKQRKISRDCIKISFFSEEIKIDDFNSLDKIQSIYLGFIVIRPTLPNIFGRNVINPNAYEKTNFSIASTSISTTVNSVKVNAVGFPHLSQDLEAIRCAEVCLLNVMEYFGNKYPEYQPVLPSTVHKLLRKISTERQLPSLGLDVPSISFVLRKLGFGTKVYHRNSLDDKTGDFRKLLYTYIESGIPVIAALSNNQNGKQGVNHAVCVIGKKSKPNSVKVEFKNFGKNVEIADYYDNFIDKLVMNDDNFSPYLDFEFENPTALHGQQNPLWENCKVISFIVPLYKKIYMDAYVARQYADSIIQNDTLFMDRSQKSLIHKTFLTSSRSYKCYISTSQTINPQLKTLILSSPMPKFIFLTEIYDTDSVKEGKITGAIIFDATESKGSPLRPIILAFHNNRLIKRLNSFDSLKKFDIICTPFISHNNLSYYENVQSSK